MSNIKYSDYSLDEVKTKFDSIASSISEAGSNVTNFSVKAGNKISGFRDKAKQKASYTLRDKLKSESMEKLENFMDKFGVEDPILNEVHIDEGVLNSYNAMISQYSKCNTAISGYGTKLNTLSSKVTQIGEIFVKIQEAFREFEDTHKNINIAELISTLIDSGAIDASAIDLEKFTVQEVDGVEVLYYDLDGQLVSISDMVNAFYTYTGVSMNANIEGRYLAEQMGVEFDEEFQNNVMNGVNGFMSDSFAHSYFGMASEESLTGAATAIGYDLSQDINYGSLLEEYGSNMDQDQINGLAALLNGDVNSLITGASSVGAALIAAYTLTDNLDFSKVPTPTPTEPTETPTPTPTEPNPTQTPTPTPTYNPVEPTPGPTTTPYPSPTPGPTTTPYPSPTPTVTPTPTPTPIEIKIEDPVDPVDPIKPIEETPDYDDLAREKFEDQGFEAINQRREEISREADRMLASEDKTELHDKLKDYGYSEPEIKEIMGDPDLTRAALIEGDQRAELTDIANDLAKADGVDNFDTKYDDGQKYNDLVDGTTSSEYIANMSQDKNVVDARDAMKDAKSDYDKGLEEAQKSYETVESNKTEMDNLKEEFGDDTSKWTEEQAEKYNTAVKEYNDSVKEYKVKADEVKDLQTAYEKSKATYDDAKSEFLSRIKESNDIRNNNSNGEGIGSYTVITPGGDTSIETGGTGTTQPNVGVTDPGTQTNQGNSNVIVEQAANISGTTVQQVSGGATGGISDADILAGLSFGDGTVGN